MSKKEIRLIKCHIRAQQAGNLEELSRIEAEIRKTYIKKLAFNQLKRGSNHD